MGKYIVCSTKVYPKKRGKYTYGGVSLNLKELTPLIGKYVHVRIEVVHKRDFLS